MTQNRRSPDRFVDLPPQGAKIQAVGTRTRDEGQRMPRARRWIGRPVALLLPLATWGGLSAPALGDQITLKDGRVIDGSIARLSSMAENPNNQNPAARPTCNSSCSSTTTCAGRSLPSGRWPGPAPAEVNEPDEKIFLRQPVPRNGGARRHGRAAGVDHAARRLRPPDGAHAHRARQFADHPGCHGNDAALVEVGSPANGRQGLCCGTCGSPPRRSRRPTWKKS